MCHLGSQSVTGPGEVTQRRMWVEEGPQVRGEGRGHGSGGEVNGGDEGTSSFCPGGIYLLSSPRVLAGEVPRRSRPVGISCRE